MDHDALALTRRFLSSRQEALEAAVSEKDAHLALLEVSGIRTAKQAAEADKLRADRRRLMERLKLVVSYSSCSRSVPSWSA